MFAAVFVLLVGTGISVLAATAWHSYVEHLAHDSFEASASSTSAALATELRRDTDFVAALTAASTVYPSTTNAQLAALLNAIDVSKRYPGGVGFGAYQRVPAAALPAFEALVTADPPTGYKFTPPYQVTPPGNRPFYCLQHLGYTTAAEKIPIPIDFDLCSAEIPGFGANPIPPLLAQATASGQTTVLAGELFNKVKGLEGLFVTFTPVYAGGVTPPTVEARSASLVSWVVGTFNGNTLVKTATSGNSDQGVAVRYDQPGSGPVTIASSAPPSGPLFVHDSTVQADGTWRVRIEDSASTTALPQALAVGVLGFALSLLLFLLFMLLMRSRSRALRLVEERTGQLRHLALHDPLTDLPNRALIVDRAERMLLRARRRQLSIGALYVDIDNFKDINDSFGHDAGDELLRSVAGRLATALRASDTVGRLGGDEFVVLAEGEAGDPGPELVAERVMAVLAEPFHLAGAESVEVVVNVSIGVALGARDDADALLHDADVALYEAKSLGKNRYVVFQPEMQVAVVERMELEIDLHHALEDGQLRLLYQPTFDLGEMSVTGVEALIRWDHPTHGRLLPASFIPIAEETGLIVPIGEFVIEEACAQAAAWHGAGYPIGMSVNVSGRQLDDPGFVGVVRGTLERSGIDPAYVTLEITEAVLMRNATVTADRLNDLKALGVRIAVDAFGTGYSSLAYLRRFPVDALKIDRSFISQIAESDESRALIRALVQLGKSLDIETLAEGIEEDAQLARVQRAQCDLGQGFLFARPLEASAVEELFTQHSIRPPAAPRSSGDEGPGGA